MKITISNKKLDSKPSDVGAYFSRKGKNPFKWQEVEITLDNFQQIAENGYTICYNQIDNKSLKRKGNFKDTSFIVIDIDSTDLNANEIIERMKYKPTIWHTSFSHKTERKEYKNCYHFYYFFDDIISNERTFENIYSQLTTGIEDLYDKNAKDCNRITFTSNKNLQNFEYIKLGNTYKVENFNIEEENTKILTFDEFINEDSKVLKNEPIEYISTHYNISYQSKSSQNENTEVKLPKNDFNLDEDFFRDLNTLVRSEFLAKYSWKYPYFSETPIEDTLFIDGYADLRGINYYVVPTAQYSWNNLTGKAEIKKIQNGHRTTMLFIDAIAFMKIVPNITKEYLVYLLVMEVYQHFMNGDGQLNNYFIIEKAKDVWLNIDKYSIQPIKKQFKLDKHYWFSQGISMFEAVKIVRKKIKSNDIGSLYDCSMTIEENIEEFKKYGVSIKKPTLINWCEENYIDFITNKEKRDNMICYYYDEDNSRSSRDIEKLLKKDNIIVSYVTINKVLNAYKKLLKN